MATPNDSAGRPPLTESEKTPAKKELCPDPVECSENGCKEKPVVAFWEKGQVFRFACDIHMLARTSFGQTVIVEDTIEQYLKRRKRKMYHKMFPQYL